MFERCLYFNANHLSRVVNVIWQRAYAELDLVPAHAYLLRLVLAEPGLIQKDIAKKLNLEKSTVTRFIDKMAEDQYLTRRADLNGNKKLQLIFPTAKAKKIEQRLNQIGEELYTRMQQLMDIDQLKVLVRDIDNAAGKIKK